MNVPSHTATDVVAFLLIAPVILLPSLLAQQSSVSTPVPTGVIAGRVVDLDTGEPIGRAIVGIYGTAGGEVFEIGVSPPPAIVDAEGPLAFGSVPAGEYRLQVEGVPSGWAAAQALRDGHDLLDGPLAIGFQPSFLDALGLASLEIPLGDGERKVQDIKVAGIGGGCP